MNQSPRRPLSERRARERRVLRVGLILSLVLHVVALAVIGDWLRSDTRPADTNAGEVVLVPPSGMRAVEISEVAVGPEPVTPVVPEPEDREQRQPERPPAVVAAAPDRAVPADAETAADRLAPRVVDPRLWQPMVLIPREPSFSEVEARVAAAVELLSDSALAEAERAIRARDWTVEDADGGKWGISPGKLHLGKLTLPLPINFVGPADVAGPSSEWYDLELQVDRAALVESFESRVKAIRERRDRERAERQKSKNGGG